MQTLAVKNMIQFTLNSFC